MKTGLMGCLALAAAAGLTGCAESDSYLLDPSVVGRWEHTPTRVPILSRINSIEGPEDDWVQASDPTPADLLPEATEYRLGPGDRVTVTVYDIPDEGKSVNYDKLIDTRGYIDLPQIGPVNLGGQTIHGAEEQVKTAMRSLVTNPLAAVEIVQMHQSRVSIFGAVQTANQYLVPTADYKLLDALTAAGGWSEASDYIYVIRSIPLSEATMNRSKPVPSNDSGKPEIKPSGPQINDLINELSKPPEKPSDKPADKPADAQPKPAPKPAGSPGVFQPPSQPAAKPPIDLIDPAAKPAPKQPAATKPAQPEPDSGDSTWVYLNGQWVKVKKPGASAVPPVVAPEAVANQPPAGAPLVTQRVIRIPSARLAAGDARVNIVVRPGDVIRVPPAPSGNIFIAGQVARPGTYGMSQGLTLTRALVAAGGLNQTAVPEKIDLVRMVGNDTQAIIRLDGRAMYEGTNPDLYVKANDMINVGTSFWATPLAIVRNGFRMSYGFGFIADRNFGNDIFGAPPTNQFGQ
jgi:polysaccharide export outer membrane protein